MELLNPSQFECVKQLFADLAANQPMCAAVLADVYPGRVYVNDPGLPRAALLLTSIESEANGIWAFLAGDPAQGGFNHSLNAALFQYRLFSEQAKMIFWTCNPDDWGGQLEAVFHPLPPIWFPRHHYIARQAHFDWCAALPEGFAVEKMEQELQQRAGLTLPEDVAATLEKWARLECEGFGRRGFCDFGFVTLDMRGATPVISSWATVDFIVAGRGDLGFFTQPDYRRRGLGTIAAAAALEHGFAHGLEQVNWTCDADNLGSTHTADKLGLERIADYRMAFMMLDEKEHGQVAQHYA